MERVDGRIEFEFGTMNLLLMYRILNAKGLISMEEYPFACGFQMSHDK
jgi:hypothetical protein